MSLNTEMLEKYHHDFLSEVQHNVEHGQWVKMCTQCGVCAGSCPLGDAWEHSPQKILMMIRANQRDEVLSSDSMWMCTSCYNCIVRCPRELPVMHIMHGLATYAVKLPLAPEHNPTRRFSEAFWNNLLQRGRINELKLLQSLYFSDGFSALLREMLSQHKLGIKMIKARRVAPMEWFNGHGVKDRSGLQKMIEKARQIEAERLQTGD